MSQTPEFQIENGVLYGVKPIDLRKAEIPEGVHTIGPRAFADCQSLAELILPNSLQEIGSNAFIFCYALKTLTLPTGLVKIAAQAFKYSGIEALILPESLTEIGEEAFYRCQNLKAITLPKTLHTIGQDAFRFCASLAITLDSAATLDPDTFSHVKTITPYARKHGTVLLQAITDEVCYQPWYAEIGFHGGEKIKIGKMPIALATVEQLMQALDGYLLADHTGAVEKAVPITAENLLMKDGAFFGATCIHYEFGTFLGQIEEETEEYLIAIPFGHKDERFEAKITQG